MSGPKLIFKQKCRVCGCDQVTSCRVVTATGQRDCQWERADLCDNPKCLIEGARRLETGMDRDVEVFKLLERARNLRMGT